MTQVIHVFKKNFEGYFKDSVLYESRTNDNSDLVIFKIVLFERV